MNINVQSVEDNNKQGEQNYGNDNNNQYGGDYGIEYKNTENQ